MTTATAQADMRRNHAYAALCGMFSETVTLLLPSGGSVTARAVVQPAKSEIRDRQYIATDVEQIDVRLAKDADATATDGTVINGLAHDSVGPGLGLVRADDTTALRVSRVFLYRWKVEETPYTWLLRFEYESIQQIGTQHIRSR